MGQKGNSDQWTKRITVQQRQYERWEKVSGCKNHNGEFIASFVNVSKAYDNGVLAVRDVSLDIRRNEFLSIVGPSGCGKSTLLKLISGVETITSGEIYYNGKKISGINTEVGYVTQESNLFPWLTLKGNVGFALRMRRIPQAKANERVNQWIRKAGLSGFENCYPHQLSGGMQKRGSIIRTLVYKPDLILMDEPFGSLDAQTRLILQQELLDLTTSENLTVLFVTHDLQEAVALSDRIALFSRSPGTVLKVFDVPLSKPRNVFEIHNYPGFSEIYDQVWKELRQQFSDDRKEAARIGF